MSEIENLEFEQVYRKFHPKMRIFAGRLCRNKEEAEDIAQDAFVKAYKSFESCDHGRQIDNWLMRIVYNTYLDRKRMKSRRVKECGNNLDIPESTIDDFADSNPTPEAIVLAGIASPQLLSALATLDADSLRLMKQFYVERRDQNELSEEYGIRIGTLRSRIHRITRKLRQELKSGPAPIRKNALA